jgi:GGDEF domain-containing protein
MLLRGFAGRLSKVLRANDSIARPGGDEFAIVVEGLRQADDAETIAQNIVSAMRLSRFASMTPSKEFAGC